MSLHGIVDVDEEDVALPTIQGTEEIEGGQNQLYRRYTVFVDIVESAALEALEALTVEEPTDVYSTPAQLGGDLITLTLLPRARWQTLLNLDVIQVPISSYYSSSTPRSRISK